MRTDERPADPLRPWDLRIEYLGDDVLGLTTERPRLSWKLPANAAAQSAYELRANVDGTAWTSGRVRGAQCSFIDYEGPAASSGRAVEWAVRVWTDVGTSDWSDTARWEAGLLTSADWSATWIRPHEQEVPKAGFRPAYHLAGSFVAGDGIRSARAYATAHGLYELFLNGRRVGDLELTPGFSSYHRHLYAQAYDIADHLVSGSNTLGAILSDGWFRGRTSYHRLPNGFGDRTALLAQVHIDYQDGSRFVWGTGPQWRSTIGAIGAADLYDGVDADLRNEPIGWSAPGAIHTGWAPVEVAPALAPVRITSSPAPPVRRLAELAPRSVTELADGTPGGAQIVDFGQNVHGWVRLAGLGPAGTEITLAHAEARSPSGDVDTSSAAPPPMFRWYQPPRGLQTDRVVSAGRESDRFEPRHTTHGFQYLRVDGLATPLDPESVRAVVVDSDVRRTGWFTCSDARLNRLYEIAGWTYRNQQCDVPLAEIARETAGWTDWGFNVPGAVLLHDVLGFSAKWLADLAAEQWPDGKVRNYAPDPLGQRSLDAMFAVRHGMPGWGDAAVLVPWELWLEYGDRKLLADQFDSMARWVDYGTRQAAAARHPAREAKRADPPAHERYLWDVAWGLGEHLEPGGDHRTPDGGTDADLDAALIAWATTSQQIDAAQQAIDHGPFATAYLHRSADLVSRAAAVLGRQAEHAKYAQLAERVRDAWQREFICPDGTLQPDTQATCVRALAFGLVPPALRADTATRLVELIRAAGTHPGTGLPATPLLLPTLVETGHADVAYDLALQTTPPAWTTVIERGGTTFWEDWDGILPDGSTQLALNMPTRASIVEFLVRGVAGIARDPDSVAYRHFRVTPHPGGGLTSAEAHHATPHGTIVSAWSLADAEFTLHLEVPPGTTATVHLPDGSAHAAGPGAHAYRTAA